MAEGAQFVVPLEAVSAAGRAAGSAASQSRGIDLGAAVEPVAAALPGSQSAAAAAALAGAWRRGMTGWADDMARHGTTLADTARAAAATDEQGARAMAAPPTPVTVTPPDAAASESASVGATLGGR